MRVESKHGRGAGGGLLCTCDGGTLQLASVCGGGAGRARGEREGPDVMNGAPRAAGKASGQAGPSPASHTCTYKSDTPALGPAGGPLSHPRAHIILALFPRRLCLPTGN